MANYKFEDAVTDWFKAYGNAWIYRDPIKASELFTDDAIYQETPFTDPSIGVLAIRRYWDEAVSTQDQVDFGFDLLTVDENKEMGIAQWWASFVRMPSREHVKLDGIAVITLNSQGLCKTFHEWWHSEAVADDSDNI